MFLLNIFFNKKWYSLNVDVQFIISNVAAILVF